MRISDWSSDVCSSDLHERDVEPTQPQRDDAEQESQERAQDSAEKEPQPGADPVVKLAQRGGVGPDGRSEEHTSELQSLMRISYAVFCLKTKIQHAKLQLCKKHNFQRNHMYLNLCTPC